MNIKSLPFIPDLVEHSTGVRQSMRTPSRFVELKRDETLRLGKHSGVSGIQVREGVIWLTETFGNGDVILQAGERFEFSNRWPVVIQSLGAAHAALLA